MTYKKIGIICAMDMECEALRNRMQNKKEVKVGSFTFYCGTFGEREVIAVVCGVGKVFAAMCTQTMILTFAPDAIYNSGVAGSLSDELEILDVAVSENLVQHDMDTTPLGDPPGLISGINQVYFPSDPSLMEALFKQCQSRGINAKTGTIASGDQFIANAEQKIKIINTFHAIACEMEGAAIAHTAFVNNTPFCAIRAISDSFAGKNEMDYAKFAPKAAQQSAELLCELLADSTLL